MKEPGNDDERLAALLARKLDRRQREQLLAELAASDDDHEVFADTASILRQIEEEDAAAAAPSWEAVEERQFAGTAPVLRHIPEDAASATSETDGVIPLHPRPRARRWQRWGAIAAGVGGIALAATLLGRQGSSAGAVPIRLAARLNHLDQGMPEQWQLSVGAARGEQTDRARAARAAQAGALLVDLSVAVQARDTADTRVLAEQLRARFDPAAPASPFRRLSARPAAPADSLQRLVSEGTDRLADRLGREHLELGAWVEAARLAAYGRNAAFFQGDGAVPRSAERLVSSDAAAAQAMARVQAALPATGPPRWNELMAALDTLQTELTNE